jgi:hypothetical protein
MDPSFVEIVIIMNLTYDLLKDAKNKTEFEFLKPKKEGKSSSWQAISGNFF